MSETTHTPGPWTVREYPHLAHPFTQSLYEIEFGGEGELICDTVYERSDANLIASAPDMLAALKEARIELHWLSNCSPAAEKIATQCDAAIANAEGGAK
mgnify:CR=1 FL=1